MNEQQIVQMLETVAEHGVPPSDQWEAIHAQVAMSQRKHRPLRRPRALGATGRWRAFASAAVVVLLVLLPLAVPPVRAAVSGFMQQRFGLVLVEPTPPRLQPTTGTPAVAGTPQLVMWVPLAEVQRNTPFPIRAPAWLPKGLIVRGAFTAPAYSSDDVDGPIKVRVQYGRADGAMGGLGIEQTATERYRGGNAIPSTKAQSVTVSGHPAVYVQGAWTSTMAMAWDETADAAMLSWNQDGFTFMIQTGSLGLTRDDLIRIAESLR